MWKISLVFWGTRRSDYLFPRFTDIFGSFLKRIENAKIFFRNFLTFSGIYYFQVSLRNITTAKRCLLLILSFFALQDVPLGRSNTKEYLRPPTNSRVGTVTRSIPKMPQRNCSALDSYWRKIFFIHYLQWFQ